MEDQISQIIINKEPYKTPGLSMEVLVGEKVFHLLAEKWFQEEWDGLYAACSWGTVFQCRAFVATWYRTYRQDYVPVLVRAVGDGRLEGLLTLAQEKSGLLVGAGAEQAEYQVWLAREAGETFIQRAFACLRALFPENDIRLKYIPGKVGLDWIKANKAWNIRHLIRVHQHPLLVADEEAINKELQKKNRREKMNRLKRLGDLSFEKITDEEVLASIFDQLACQYDFRKGALFNKITFQEDPLRKGFLLSLFEQGLLHATVFKLNKEIIASNIGIKGKRWVHLQGINTHAPQYARYSPGILHFLLLGKCLAEEGIEAFDLTPGNDCYKQGLATKYTCAYEFILTSLYRGLATDFKYGLIKKVKAATPYIGVNPGSLKKLKRAAILLKERIHKTYKEGLFASLTHLWNQTRIFKEEQLCQVKPYPREQERGLNLRLNKGSLEDLLKYDQKGSLETRRNFLAKAMSRLESGQIPLTWSEENRLLACAWVPAESTGIKGTAAGDQTRQESIYLEEVYCHAHVRDNRDIFLSAVAAEIMRTSKFVKVLAKSKHAKGNYRHKDQVEYPKTPDKIKLNKSHSA